MKAVFPCKGIVVLDKKDIPKLESIYRSKLISSKISEIYKNTQYSVQVGNLNYLPPKANIVVDEDSDDFLSHPFFTTLKPLK